MKTVLRNIKWHDLSEWITKPSLSEAHPTQLNYNDYFYRMAKIFQNNLKNQNHEQTN